MFGRGNREDTRSDVSIGPGIDSDGWRGRPGSTSGLSLLLVERDVRYGWSTPDEAKTAYGVMVDGEGKVKTEESDVLRQRMREERREKSVDARDWWRQERERVLKKEWAEDVYNMFADVLKWEKFRRQFFGMWQFPDDYGL